MALANGATERGRGLTLTVEELVAKYTHTQRLNEQLCAFIDVVCVECNSLAENLPSAAQALRDLSLTALDAKSALECKTMTGNVCSGKNYKNDPNEVLEGTAVMREGLDKGQKFAVRDTAKSRFLRFVEEAKRDYKEECSVLRLRMLAMLGSEQLLAQARRKLLEQEEDYRASVLALSACREELDVSRSQCSFLLRTMKCGDITSDDSITNSCCNEFCDCVSADNHKNSEVSVPSETIAAEGTFRCCVKARLVKMEIMLRESQETVTTLETSVRQLSYNNDQLKTRLEALTTERDELRMCNERLEGQVQRLSSTLQEGSEVWSQKRERSHETVTLPQQMEVAAEQAEVKKRLHELQCENSSLQNLVLQLQRQVNDFELRAEESCAGRDEMVTQLKEEVVSLRGVLSEREVALQQTSCEWRRAARQWSLLNRVHTTVVRHLSTRLVREVAAAATAAQISAGTPTSDELPAAVSSTAVSSADGDRERELLLLLESKEAKHRAALQHMRQTNHELRSALAASQEELKRRETQIGVVKPPQGTDAVDVTAHVQHDIPKTSNGEPDVHEGSLTERNNVESVNTSDWRELQAENATLTQRVAELQECKESLDALVEDYRKRCDVLEREVARNAETMNTLVVNGAISPASMHTRRSDGALIDPIQFRSLQCMLRNTLEKNMLLSARVSELENRLPKT